MSSVEQIVHQQLPQIVARLKASECLFSINVGFHSLALFAPYAAKQKYLSDGAATLE